MAQIEQLMETIKGMTVIELNELVKALEEEFDVSAAAAGPVMMAGMMPGAAAEAAGAEEELREALKEVDDRRRPTVGHTESGGHASARLLQAGHTLRELEQRRGRQHDGQLPHELVSVVSALRHSGALAGIGSVGILSQSTAQTRGRPRRHALPVQPVKNGVPLPPSRACKMSAEGKLCCTTWRSDATNALDIPPTKLNVPCATAPLVVGSQPAVIKRIGTIAV
jgi:hypothetical protein